MRGIVVMIGAVLCGCVPGAGAGVPSGLSCDGAFVQCAGDGATVPARCMTAGGGSEPAVCGDWEDGVPDVLRCPDGAWPECTAL